MNERLRGDGSHLDPRKQAECGGLRAAAPRRSCLPHTRLFLMIMQMFLAAIAAICGSFLALTADTTLMAPGGAKERKEKRVVTALNSEPRLQGQTSAHLPARTHARTFS